MGMSAEAPFRAVFADVKRGGSGRRARRGTGFLNIPLLPGSWEVGMGRGGYIGSGEVGGGDLGW